MLNQPGYERRNREVHQHVLIDVLQARIAIISKLFNQPIDQVILVPEEIKIFP